MCITIDAFARSGVAPHREPDPQVQKEAEVMDISISTDEVGNAIKKPSRRCFFCLSLDSLLAKEFFDSVLFLNAHFSFIARLNIKSIESLSCPRITYVVGVK